MCRTYTNTANSVLATADTNIASIGDGVALAYTALALTKGVYKLTVQTVNMDGQLSSAAVYPSGTDTFVIA